ncbi:MAG: NAD-dependent epimerase/dehydratase family protein, partial [Ornithinibacter sp.]
MNRTERTGPKPVPLAWVVGGGGLVGRHVARALALAGHELFEAPVRWRDEALSASDLVAGMARFGLERRGRPWLVAWCAGAGVVATPEEDLAAELRVFEQAMSALNESVTPEEEGVFVLASSAGGLYAGSQHPPFTEASETQPLVAYGRTKLKMEDVVRSMAPVSGLRVVLARLANVYGPGQSLMKPQGLLSQLCLAHATGRALPVFVSTDTIRDYVYAGDVGAMFVAL